MGLAHLVQRFLLSKVFYLVVILIVLAYWLPSHTTLPQFPGHLNADEKLAPTNTIEEPLPSDTPKVVLVGGSEDPPEFTPPEPSLTSSADAAASTEDHPEPQHFGYYDDMPKPTRSSSTTGTPLASVAPGHGYYAHTPQGDRPGPPDDTFNHTGSDGSDGSDGLRYNPLVSTEDTEYLPSKAFTDACPHYIFHSEQRHEPYSKGKYSLSYQRPDPECRTFKSPGVDELIERFKDVIKDPDLYRIFENSFPNTLDTAIRWKGNAKETGEELTFIITGDINAMWLRDSSNQLQSYLPLLNASTSTNSIASLYRGVINLQARYIRSNPYCNSFQPPRESGIHPNPSGASKTDKVKPEYNDQIVFECKYELDSLAAFLEISHDYYTATNDIAFFQKGKWANTIKDIINIVKGMMEPTYADDGAVNVSPYTFSRLTRSSSDALNNLGAGNPVAADTGLIRSTHRPSDDSVIYQFFIPGNMMFARYLESAAKIMEQINGQMSFANDMSDFATSLREAITKHGIVKDRKYGEIYAFEVDGFGGTNLMDDSNIPSLLSAPFFGYLNASDKVYQNTRKKILSNDNPYFMRGPVINAVGGPHDGPGRGWPMASIVRIMTSDSDTEIYATLKEIVASTAGLGLIHESINTFDARAFTRQWFSWANGLFGQMILDLERRKPHLLKRSYQ